MLEALLDIRVFKSFSFYIIHLRRAHFVGAQPLFNIIANVDSVALLDSYLKTVVHNKCRVVPATAADTKRLSVPVTKRVEFAKIGKYLSQFGFVDFIQSVNKDPHAGHIASFRQGARELFLQRLQGKYGSVGVRLLCRQSPVLSPNRW
jgi:hypothetical protein